LLLYAKGVAGRQVGLDGEGRIVLM